MWRESNHKCITYAISRSFQPANGNVIVWLSAWLLVLKIAPGLIELGAFLSLAKRTT